MTLPKLKFCWSGAHFEAEWRFGLFGFYQRGQLAGRRRGLAVSVRGLLAWSAGLAVVAYLSAALALWFWFERRPYNFVTYADLVLPTRWDGVQKLRGQALVAEGMDDIKARRWGEGMQKLRIGIARNPGELKGRLVLGELFLAMRARKQAIEVYEGGLASAYPGREYVETVIKVATQSEDFDLWLRACDRALALVEGRESLAADRRWLIREKIRVLTASERTEEALALAEKEGESGSPAISELRVLALLAAGRPAEAVGFLEAWTGRKGGKPDGQIVRLQVRALREAGDMAGMDRALDTLRQLAPADPRPYIYGVVQWLLAGRREEALRGFDGFLLRFGSKPEFLQPMADPLTRIEEREVLERLVEHARQHGFDTTPFRQSLVQSLVARGEWRDAAREFDVIKAPKEKREAFVVWHELIDAQIKAALDPSEGTQSNLVTLVRNRQFTLVFYKDLIANLRRAGRAATAREIVTFAQGVYPETQALETARKELDAQLAAAAPAAPEVLISAAKHAEAAKQIVSVATPRRELGEKAFMTKLEGLTQSADHQAALQLINEVRQARPAWLPASESEITRAEVRLNGRVGDLLALRAAARRYITGERLRSAQMIEVARELHAADRKDGAILLLKELLAKVPDYAVASRLLEEWSPKSASQVP